MEHMVDYECSVDLESNIILNVFLPETQARLLSSWRGCYSLQLLLGFDDLEATLNIYNQYQPGKLPSLKQGDVRFQQKNVPDVPDGINAIQHTLQYI